MMVVVVRQLGQSHLISLLLQPLIFSHFLVFLILLFPHCEQKESIMPHYHHNGKTIWDLIPGKGQLQQVCNFIFHQGGGIKDKYLLIIICISLLNQ